MVYLYIKNEKLRYKSMEHHGVEHQGNISVVWGAIFTQLCRYMNRAQFTYLQRRIKITINHSICISSGESIGLYWQNPSWTPLSNIQRFKSSTSGGLECYSNQPEHSNLSWKMMNSLLRITIAVWLTGWFYLSSLRRKAAPYDKILGTAPAYIQLKYKV